MKLQEAIVHKITCNQCTSVLISKYGKNHRKFQNHQFSSDFNIKAPVNPFFCQHIMNFIYLRKDKWQLWKEQKDSHNMHFWLYKHFSRDREFFLVHILRWLCVILGENVHMNIGFSRLVHIDMWQWTLCMQPVNAMVWKGFFALVEIYPCEMAPIWHIGIYLKSKIVISKAIIWLMILHFWN